MRRVFSYSVLDVLLLEPDEEEEEEVPKVNCWL
jgi:hypothetical protein